ncbi:acetylxylan esterase [candidate division KSB1 bacterium]|nr:acetylxylan esterase [candidate division KSB1 bacterium]
MKINSYRSFLIIFVWCILASYKVAVAGSGTENLSVLNLNPDRPKSEEMMRGHLRRLVHDALDRRLDNYEALKTEQQIRAYQKDMRQFFLQQLDLPERTPLNASIVSQKAYNDYRLEKIIYESQPGFYVAALFYLPMKEPPYPGVLLLCGHDELGKAAYQEIAILLVKNGMAVLCPDPIGQGERKQILNENNRGEYRTTTEHMIEGIAPVLLGKSLATYMIWDGIRGIDYLVSRPEIDPSRIGCTGISGGGNRTSYLMALDDRILCAAPGCFITTTRRKNESPGPGDAEQNIHGQIAYGMDLPDYMILRAPVPTLVLSATRDFVPIEGTWEAFRQAKRVYTRLEYAERVDIIETDELHGFSTQLRVGAVRWMRRWLLKVDDAITETELPLEAPEELECTPGGQVLLLPGARSVFDLNINKEKHLTDLRNGTLSQMKPEEIRKKIRDVTGIRKPEDLPNVKIEESGIIQRKGYNIKKLVLSWDTDITLPALLFRPEKPVGERYLYLHGKGKHVDAGPGGPIEKLVLAGNIVMAVDLRGIGETGTTPWRYQDAIEFTGNDAAEFFIAYMLGISFLGMRAEDILVSARYLAEQVTSTKQRDAHIIAIGEAGPPALHIMALEPGLFDTLILQRSLFSWENVVQTPVTKGMLNNVVHGALKAYDLPDLISLIGKDRVFIRKPINAKGMDYLSP